jgi:hypothetical protein
MIHAVSLFDILNKRYLDCVVQPGRKKNEYRAICDLIDRYPYRYTPIIIADRGFASYNVFAHAINKGVFFLIRAKDINVKRLLNTETLPEHLDKHVDIILTRTHSKKKWRHPEKAGQYRYISSEVSFDYIEQKSCGEYPLSLRIVRFEVKKGIYVNIISNLSADEFPIDEICIVYQLRWDIEISFRDLKHTIGTTNFHSKNTEYIEQEILGRLILFNFCAIITTHVTIEKKGKKHIYKINFAMAIKICHEFLRVKKGKPPPDVESLIGRYLLPIRLGRNYARLHRFQLPASFCYRFS